jgi:MYXO-CTERM domain-containing protein
MRTARVSSSLIALVAVLLAPAVAGAETELKNDAFVSGGTASFMQGFVAGEMGAARFVPDGPCTITKLQLLFGGASTAQAVTLHIYDDSAGVSTPGAALVAATDVTLQGSNSALSEIDLTTLGQITATGPFRVALEFQHAGFPSIARDDDGNTHPDRNFIYASGTGWTRSQDSGVAGDWVIRAFVLYPWQHDAGVQQDAAVQVDAEAQADAPAQTDAPTQPEKSGGCAAADGPATPGLLAFGALVALGALGRRRRRRP